MLFFICWGGVGGVGWQNVPSRKLNKMVQLMFKVIIEKDFETVWLYYSNFLNISEWDPAIRSAEALKSLPEHVGSEYKVVNHYNGKESEVRYTTRSYKKTDAEASLEMWGENDQSTSFGLFLCSQRGPNTTEFQYYGEVSLKGNLCLLEPFYMSSLQKVGEDAAVGCVKKARELWGKAELVTEKATTEKIQVPAGQFTQKYITMAKGQIATWDFTTEGQRTIGYSVTFNKNTVVEYVRYENLKETVSGAYTAEEEGVLGLKFDNSFSWVSSKCVMLRLESGSIPMPGAPQQAPVELPFHVLEW